MACDALGLRARLVEIDPRFVDVIVRRWQDATGGIARWAGEQPFAEVAAVLAASGSSGGSMGAPISQRPTPATAGSRTRRSRRRSPRGASRSRPGGKVDPEARRPRVGGQHRRVQAAQQRLRGAQHRAPGPPRTPSASPGWRTRLASPCANGAPRRSGYQAARTLHETYRARPRARVRAPVRHAGRGDDVRVEASRSDGASARPSCRCRIAWRRSSPAKDEPADIHRTLTAELRQAALEALSRDHGD